MDIMIAVLLLIAFVSLIGVRFIPRSGRLRHAWLLFCIINLTAVAIISFGSFEKDQKIRKLELQFAPRLLSQEQLLKLAEQIKRYKNIRARLEYIALDPEARTFAKQVKRGLKLAGWVFPENDTPLVSPSFPRGISLYARNTPNEALESLSLILAEFGFTAQIRKEEELPENIILIRIGKK